jgi:hypothetical protein
MEPQRRRRTDHEPLNVDDHMQRRDAARHAYELYVQQDGEHALLVARIRGEYREMPGLRLTFVQACRLWQLDTGTCEAVLHTLLTEGFLARTSNGMFIALPTPNASASLPLQVAREPRAGMPLQRRSA